MSLSFLKFYDMLSLVRLLSFTKVTPYFFHSPLYNSHTIPKDHKPQFERLSYPILG